VTEDQRDRWAPRVVLIGFLLLTGVATRYVWSSSRMAARARFDGIVQQTRDSIAYRVDTYVNLLRATRAWFSAAHTVSRNDFHTYVGQLELSNRYPGLQGMGLSMRVPADQVPAVVQQVQSWGIPNFHIWPAAPARPEYHTIVYFEPDTQANRAVIGYDMMTSPPRREAMERARDSANVAATQRVTLYGAVFPRQPAFTVYAPLYKPDVSLATIPARRAALNGFIFARFVTPEVLSAISRQLDPSVGFEVYDGLIMGPGQLVYASTVEQPRFFPRFTAVRPINIAGRPWTIRFFAVRGGYAASIAWSVLTLTIGLLISFLLWALLRTQARARADAERTAEQLRKSEAALQEANRAKDEFLATLSHELRTPMTAIIGWAQMLAEPIDDEMRESAVSAILNSAKIQAQLIDDLLDVSRITAGKMRLEPKPTDVRRVAEAARDAVAPAADARGVSLELNLSRTPVVVRGDPQRLQQVIWNLLSNAVKFTPGGGVVTVTVRATQRDAMIEVRDTGQGIDPEFLPHVFERFRQADSSTSRRQGGLGLGLAIVRHLVELHGGDVRAQSDGIGRGSLFTVRLPLVTDRDTIAAVIKADESQSHMPVPP
jgi:signal transduction histidine kinase